MREPRTASTLTMLLAAAFMIALAAPAVATEITPLVIDQQLVVDLTAPAQASAMTPLLPFPKPGPKDCYQGRACDERIDCGYDSANGGWQGVCDDGYCMCY